VAGVCASAAVARVLAAPLDVVAVRKVGHPLQLEYGIGAVTPGDGVCIRGSDGLTEAELAAAVEESQTTTPADVQRSRSASLRPDHHHQPPRTQDRAAFARYRPGVRGLDSPHHRRRAAPPRTRRRRELFLATSKVEDFNRWWSVFTTTSLEKRKQHGSKGSQTFRDPNEEGRVWVLFDWDAEG
jgi:hypothetical protein